MEKVIKLASRSLAFFLKASIVILPFNWRQVRYVITKVTHELRRDADDHASAMSKWKMRVAIVT